MNQPFIYPFAGHLVSLEVPRDSRALVARNLTSTEGYFNTINKAVTHPQGFANFRVNFIQQNPGTAFQQIKKRGTSAPGPIGPICEHLLLGGLDPLVSDATKAMLNHRFNCKDACDLCERLELARSEQDWTSLLMECGTSPRGITDLYDALRRAGMITQAASAAVSRTDDDDL